MDMHKTRAGAMGLQQRRRSCLKHLQEHPQGACQYLSTEAGGRWQYRFLCRAGWVETIRDVIDRGERKGITAET